MHARIMRPRLRAHTRWQAASAVFAVVYAKRDNVTVYGNVHVTRTYAHTSDARGGIERLCARRECNTQARDPVRRT